MNPILAVERSNGSDNAIELGGLSLFAAGDGALQSWREAGQCTGHGKFILAGMVRGQYVLAIATSSFCATPVRNRSVGCFVNDDKQLQLQLLVSH